MCYKFLIFILRANTRRPVRRTCSLDHSPPCARLVTLSTARRSTSLSAGYNCLTFISQNELSHSFHNSWTTLCGWSWHCFLSLQKLYKAKFEKEKGKSVYNHMITPPDVQHAMDVAKNQSNVSHLHNCAKMTLYWFYLQLTISTFYSCICIFWGSFPHAVFCLLSCPPPQISYKKDAKANLHYTSVVDRPDIKKATQAAKLISEVMSKYMHRTHLG